MRRRVGLALVALLAAVGSAAGYGTAAYAVTQDRTAVLSSWTQTSSASYNSWNSARQNQGAWAEYGFDWSTDYCSYSPDNPLGFDFKLSCHRHDFGYRNYHAIGRFDDNKSRLDSAFYQDMLRKCGTYGSIVRPACESLAWAYYQAVREFGQLVVDQADLDRAAQIKAAAEQRAAVG